MKKVAFIKVSTIAVLFASIIMFFSACQKDDDAFAGLASPQEKIETRSQPPSVPAILEVPAGNVVSFHVYADGFQVYIVTENPTGVFSWVLKAPDATLYGNSGFHGEVGTHYLGPTWESNSGSKVVGTRLQGVTVDPNAIPWLLLGAVSSQGPGILDGTTFIQRVNTVGGKAPTTGANSSTVGQEVSIAYTAEYYFYQAE